MALSRSKSSHRRRQRPAADATPPARQLVADCLAGSQSAWERLVDRYGRLVYSIPRRYGFCDADADDVFQSVMTILYRKLDSIRDTDRLASWLISTTHRECYRVGRRAGRDADLDSRITDVGAPADEDAQTWEFRHEVRLALQRLGGRCEELLTALFLAPGDPSYEDIARRLDMKVGSIGPTRARCFEKLEKILVEMGVVEPRQAEPSGR